MTVKIVDVYAKTTIPAPADDLESGDMFNDTALGACVVLGLNPNKVTGEPIAVAYRGVVEVPSASGTTLAKAATVEYDATSKLAVADTAGDFDIGSAVVAKTSGQTVAQILLNE